MIADGGDYDCAFFTCPNTSFTATSSCPVNVDVRLTGPQQHLHWLMPEHERTLHSAAAHALIHSLQNIHTTAIATRIAGSAQSRAQWPDEPQ